MKIDMLKEYLGIVVDMEQSIFLQERLSADLKKQIEKLLVPKAFIDPAPPALPEKPPKDSFGKWVGVIAMCVGMVIYTFWIPLLIALAIWILLSVFLWSNIEVEFGMPLSLALAYGGYAIFIFKALINQEISYPKRQYDEEMIVYNLQRDAYRVTIQQNQLMRQRDKEEREVKTLLLQSELSRIATGLESSRKTLLAIYEKNIIFPKYRNLIAACSLYEYICAGRCSSLEGHEGAYNIYETEMRLDRIITQLDNVIIHLDAIRKNQFMLYSAIQDMNQRSALILESTQTMAGQLHALNRQTGNVSKQIAELQKNSALTAYHAERTQKELAYMNRMDYLSGRNDDVFFNRPPV